MDTLVSQGALSPLDQVTRLLDGLSNDHRMKVLSFCAKNKWKLSAQDVGTVDPNYEELKQFVLREAQTSQIWAVYDKEQAMREGQPISEVSIIPRFMLTSSGAITSDASVSATLSLLSSPSVPPASPIPSISAPNDSSRVDSIEELTKQIAQLSLFLQATVQKWPVVSGQSGSSASGAP